MSGLHAILIGVSRYDQVKSGKAHDRPFIATSLDGPARTVSRLAAWLKTNSSRLAAPLKSLRILASPTEGELQEGEIPEAKDATRDNVVSAIAAWREDGSQCKDDVTFFYFAGHGIQRSATDSVLVLQDFNLGLTHLANSISLQNIYGGMGSVGGHPNLARSQWYFADCCRSAVEALQGYETAQTAQVFNVEANYADDRRAPIFLAANSGQETFTHPGSLTAFGADLLSCFEGSAAEQQMIRGKRTWSVSANSLIDGMSYLTDAYNTMMANVLSDWNHKNPQTRISREYRRTPVVHVVGNPWICTLPEAPTVPCFFTPEPHTVDDLVDLQLCPRKGDKVIHVKPFETLTNLRLPAGFYDVGATRLGPPPFSDKKRVINPETVLIVPPFCVLEVPQ